MDSYYWPLVMNVAALGLLGVGLKISLKRKGQAGCLNVGLLCISIAVGLVAIYATINYFFIADGLDQGAMAYSMYAFLFTPCATFYFLFSLAIRDKLEHQV